MISIRSCPPLSRACALNALSVSLCCCASKAMRCCILVFEARMFPCVRWRQRRSDQVGPASQTPKSMARMCFCARCLTHAWLRGCAQARVRGAVSALARPVALTQLVCARAGAATLREETRHAHAHALSLASTYARALTCTCTCTATATCAGIGTCTRTRTQTGCAYAHAHAHAHAHTQA
eukprot:5694099-Pleurochrysis_carterae.AAC.2